MKKPIGFLSILFAPMLYASDGIYLGAALGYGSMNLFAQQDFDIEQSEITGKQDEDFTASAFIATPIVGYEWQWSPWRLGVEAQAFWTPVIMHLTDNDNVKYDVGIKNEYVLLFRPGYQIFERTPLTVNLNVGATYATLSGEADNPTAVTSADFGEEHVWGYKVGLGFGYDLTKHWRFRADYIYSQYEEFSKTEPRNFGSVHVPTVAPETLSITTSESQYLIGITYKW